MSSTKHCSPRLASCTDVYVTQSSSPTNDLAMIISYLYLARQVIALQRLYLFPQHFQVLFHLYLYPPYFHYGRYFQMPLVIAKFWIFPWNVLILDAHGSENCVPWMYVISDFSPKLKGSTKTTTKHFVNLVANFTLDF